MIKTAKQLPLLRSSIALFRSLLRQSYHTATIRLYRLELSHLPATSETPWQVEINQHHDLAGYDPQVGWQSAEDFRRCADERFARSEMLFSISVDQKLAHYGWLIYPTRMITIPEVGQSYELPEDSAYLYDFFTHPAFRKRGMYQASLQRILVHLSSQQCTAAYIGVAPSNVPSCRAIEKLGFQPVATLGYRRIATNVRRWVEDHVSARQRDLR
jgi:RimJ/RimL family protein N-acetyltransferase